MNFISTASLSQFPSAQERQSKSFLSIDFIYFKTHHELVIFPMGAMSSLKEWNEVSGFAGFGLFLPAVSGAADPCSRWLA
jgi:hypothetical protein